MVVLKSQSVPFSHHETTTSVTPTTALVTINFAAQTARYIKVVQTGTVTPNWWSLYEFNVYN